MVKTSPFMLAVWVLGWEINQNIKKKKDNTVTNSIKAFKNGTHQKSLL